MCSSIFKRYKSPSSITKDVNSTEWYLYDKFHRYISTHKINDIAYYLRYRDGITYNAFLNFKLIDASDRQSLSKIQAVSFYVRPSEIANDNLDLLAQIESADLPSLILAGLTESYGIRFVFSVSYQGLLSDNTEIYNYCYDKMLQYIRTKYSVNPKSNKNPISSVGMMKAYSLVDRTASFTPYIIT